MKMKNCSMIFSELLHLISFRDRVSALWGTIRDHLSNILVNATQHRYSKQKSMTRVVDVFFVICLPFHLQSLDAK